MRDSPRLLFRARRRRPADRVQSTRLPSASLALETMSDPSGFFRAPPTRPAEAPPTPGSRTLPLFPLVLILLLATACSTAFTQFAIPYEQRFQHGSFTVAPPWIQIRNEVEGPAGFWTAFNQNQPVLAFIKSPTRPPTTRLTLRNIDGGVIIVTASTDPDLRIPPILDDSFLEEMWRVFAATLQAQLQQEPKLIEKKSLPGLYPTVYWRYELNGVRHTQAGLFDPPRMVFVNYIGSPTNPTIHIDGFDRVVRSLRFNAVPAS